MLLFEVIFLLVFITIVILIIVADNIILINLFIALLHDEVCDSVKDLVAEVLSDQLRDEVMIFFLLDVIHCIHVIGDRLVILGCFSSSNGLCLLILLILTLSLSLSQQLLVMSANLQDKLGGEVQELLLGDSWQMEYNVPTVVHS